MYTDEYVPTMMPTTIAAAKSKISPTPKMSRPVNESAVTPDVKMVRDRVSLIAMLMISGSGLPLYAPSLRECGRRSRSCR